MMILPTVVTVQIPEDAAFGILLTAISALAKSSKTNSTAPVGVLLRERLSAAERKALNVMLHKMTQSIASSSKNKKAIKHSKEPLLDSVKEVVVSQNVASVPHENVLANYLRDAFRQRQRDEAQAATARKD